MNKLFLKLSFTLGTPPDEYRNGAGCRSLEP